jgi:D-glycero-beta-D-manno-heptose 1-phosphate adenylyltransferase
MERDAGEEGFRGKIAPDLASLERRVAALKRAGKTVVFTNGGFDILHVGHLRSLLGARALGDHLIVAVNADDSIRRSKGPGRPIFPAGERVEVLAALECVDSIIVFGERTVDAVLDRLRPHIHAKGPDYRDGPPEAATVKAYGGRLAIVGDPKSHSTTEVIERIRKLDAGPGNGGRGGPAA